MTHELRTALEAHVRGLRMGTVMDPPPVYLAANMADWMAEALDPQEEVLSFDDGYDAGYEAGQEAADE